jgi:hypothetical protein
MNDDDLITTVRERFAPLRMNVPSGTVMARGTAMRRRRHGGQLAAGALAVALGAGLGVPALTTAGHASGPAAGARTATLTAWTVDRQPGGAIAVTIRRLRDLPALQRELASDGARITISADELPTMPRSCLSPTYRKIDGGRSAEIQLSPVVAPPNNLDKGLYFTLYPDRVPPGEVLRLTVFAHDHMPSDGATARKPGNMTGAFPGALGLLGSTYNIFLTEVRDAPACTS